MDSPLLASRTAIYGVDFSGAMDAERKIWIARGVPAGRGLIIEDCAPLADLCPAAKGPQGSARALAELIRRQPGAAISARRNTEFRQVRGCKEAY